MQTLIDDGGEFNREVVPRLQVVALQHVLPQHLLTSLVYKVTRSRMPMVKNALISSFMKGFKPEMSDAVQPNPLAYESFNEFFTRPLKPDARPFKRDAHTLISPVDASIEIPAGKPLDS